VGALGCQIGWFSEESHFSMTYKRFLWLGLGTTTIVATYLLQHSFNPYHFFHEGPVFGFDPQLGVEVRQPAEFIAVKLFRYLMNDLGAIAIIYGLFGSGKYLRFAWVVMLVGGMVLLPTYLWLKIHEGPGMSAILQQLHRLTVNPVLMLVLIPAFYYQQLLEKKRGE
jgi:exosortase F-associated protein